MSPVALEITFTLAALVLLGVSLFLFRSVDVRSIRPLNFMYGLLFVIGLGWIQSKLLFGTTTVSAFVSNFFRALFNSDIEVVSFLGGVVFNFIDGLEEKEFLEMFFNVFLIFIYALVRLLIFGIPRWFSGVSEVPSKSSIDNLTFKRMARWAFWLPHVVIIVGLPFIFIGKSFTFPWIQDFAIALEVGSGGVLWALSYVLCAEIYYSVDSPKSLTKKVAEAAESSLRVNANIDDLINTYWKMPEEMAPVAFFERQKVIPNDVPSEDAGRQSLDLKEAKFDRVLNRMNTGGQIVDRTAVESALDEIDASSVGKFIQISGNMNDYHYLLLAELLLGIHDEGGVSLIICPDDIRSDVETNFRSMIGLVMSDMLVSWRHIGKNSSNGGSRGSAGTGGRSHCDILIGAETDLYHSFMSHGAQELAQEIDRLRLVIVLDFHRIDLSILRLEISRMKLLGFYKNISTVVQGEVRNRQDTQLNQLFSVGARGFKSMELRQADNKRRTWMVWRESPEGFAALKQHFNLSKRSGMPLTYLPLLLIPAWEAESIERIGFLDPDFKHDKHAWDSADHWLDFLHDASTNSNTTPAPSKLLDSVSAIHHVGCDEDGFDVLFMEDHDNLAEAAWRTADISMAKMETLVMIVSKGYPLRDFFHELCSEHGAGFSTDKHLPLSPNPTGDINQVANSVLTLIRQNNGASQKAVTEMLQELGSSKILAELNVTASKNGLEGLFRHALGRHERVNRTYDEKSHRVILSADQPGASDLVNPLFAPVVAGGGKIGQVKQGDEGLTYCREGYMQMDGLFYKIENINREIDSDRVTDVRAVSANDSWRSDQLRLQPETHFCKSYSLNTNEIVVEQNYRTDRRYSSLVHLSYERSTSSYCMTERDRGPSAGIEWEPMNSSHQGVHVHTEQRRYKPCWHRSFDCPESEDLVRIALSLSMTLQDTLRSLFPREWNRLVVVAPEATPYFDSLRNHDDYFIKFMARKYPAMGPSALIELKSFYEAVYWRNGATGMLPELECSIPSINLFVIEDSPYDLGCCRALADKRNIELWRDYVDWLGSDIRNQSYYNPPRLADSEPLLDLLGSKAVLQKAVW